MLKACSCLLQPPRWYENHSADYCTMQEPPVLLQTVQVSSFLLQDPPTLCFKHVPFSNKSLLNVTIMFLWITIQVPYVCYILYQHLTVSNKCLLSVVHLSVSRVFCLSQASSYLSQASCTLQASYDFHCEKTSRWLEASWVLFFCKYLLSVTESHQHGRERRGDRVGGGGVWQNWILFN